MEAVIPSNAITLEREEYVKRFIAAHKSYIAAQVNHKRGDELSRHRILVQRGQAGPFCTWYFNKLPDGTGELGVHVAYKHSREGQEEDLYLVHHLRPEDKLEILWMNNMAHAVMFKKFENWPVESVLQALMKQPDVAIPGTSYVDYEVSVESVTSVAKNINITRHWPRPAKKPSAWEDAFPGLLLKPIMQKLQQVHPGAVPVFGAVRFETFRVHLMQRWGVHTSGSVPPYEAGREAVALHFYATVLYLATNAVTGDMAKQVGHHLVESEVSVYLTGATFSRQAPADDQKTETSGGGSLAISEAGMSQPTRLLTESHAYPSSPPFRVQGPGASVNDGPLRPAPNPGSHPWTISSDYTQQAGPSGMPVTVSSERMRQAGLSGMPVVTVSSDYTQQAVQSGTAGYVVPSTPSDMPVAVFQRDAVVVVPKSTASGSTRQTNSSNMSTMTAYSSPGAQPTISVNTPQANSSHIMGSRVVMQPSRPESDSTMSMTQQHPDSSNITRFGAPPLSLQHPQYTPANSQLPASFTASGATQQGVDAHMYRQTPTHGMQPPAVMQPPQYPTSSTTSPAQQASAQNPGTTTELRRPSSQLNTSAPGSGSDGFQARMQYGMPGAAWGWQSVPPTSNPTTPPVAGTTHDMDVHTSAALPLLPPLPPGVPQYAGRKRAADAAWMTQPSATPPSGASPPFPGGSHNPYQPAEQSAKGHQDNTQRFDPSGGRMVQNMGTWLAGEQQEVGHPSKRPRYGDTANSSLPGPTTHGPRDLTAQPWRMGDEHKQDLGGGSAGHAAADTSGSLLKGDVDDVARKRATHVEVSSHDAPTPTMNRFDPAHQPGEVGFQILTMRETVRHRQRLLDYLRWRDEVFYQYYAWPRGTLLILNRGRRFHSMLEPGDKIQVPSLSMSEYKLRPPVRTRWEIVPDRVPGVSEVKKWWQGLGLRYSTLNYPGDILERLNPGIQPSELSLGEGVVVPERDGEHPMVRTKFEVLPSGVTLDKWAVDNGYPTTILFRLNPRIDPYASFQERKLLLVPEDQSECIKYLIKADPGSPAAARAATRMISDTPQHPGPQHVTVPMEQLMLRASSAANLPGVNEPPQLRMQPLQPHNIMVEGTAQMPSRSNQAFQPYADITDVMPAGHDGAGTTRGMQFGAQHAVHQAVQQAVQQAVHTPSAQEREWDEVSAQRRGRRYTGEREGQLLVPDSSTVNISAADKDDGDDDDGNDGPSRDTVTDQDDGDDAQTENTEQQHEPGSAARLVTAGSMDPAMVHLTDMMQMHASTGDAGEPQPTVAPEGSSSSLDKSHKTAANTPAKAAEQSVDDSVHGTSTAASPLAGRPQDQYTGLNVITREKYLVGFFTADRCFMASSTNVGMHYGLCMRPKHIMLLPTAQCGCFLSWCFEKMAVGGLLRVHMGYKSTDESGKVMDQHLFLQFELKQYSTFMALRMNGMSYAELFEKLQTYDAQALHRLLFVASSSKDDLREKVQTEIRMIWRMEAEEVFTTRAIQGQPPPAEPWAHTFPGLLLPMIVVQLMAVDPTAQPVFGQNSAENFSMNLTWLWLVNNPVHSVDVNEYLRALQSQHWKNVRGVRLDEYLEAFQRADERYMVAGRNEAFEDQLKLTLVLRGRSGCFCSWFVTKQKDGSANLGVHVAYVARGADGLKYERDLFLQFHLHVNDHLEVLWPNRVPHAAVFKSFQGLSVRSLLPELNGAASTPHNDPQDLYRSASFVAKDSQFGIVQERITSIAKNINITRRWPQQAKKPCAWEEAFPGLLLKPIMERLQYIDPEAVPVFGTDPFQGFCDRITARWTSEHQSLQAERLAEAMSYAEVLHLVTSDSKVNLVEAIGGSALFQRLTAASPQVSLSAGQPPVTQPQPQPSQLSPAGASQRQPQTAAGSAQVQHSQQGDGDAAAQHKAQSATPQTQQQQQSKQSTSTQAHPPSTVAAIQQQHSQQHSQGQPTPNAAAALTASTAAALSAAAEPFPGVPGRTERHQSTPGTGSHPGRESGAGDQGVGQQRNTAVVTASGKEADQVPTVMDVDTQHHQSTGNAANQQQVPVGTDTVVDETPAGGISDKQASLKGTAADVTQDGEAALKDTTAASQQARAQTVGERDGQQDSAALGPHTEEEDLAALALAELRGGPSADSTAVSAKTAAVEQQRDSVQDDTEATQTVVKPENIVPEDGKDIQQQGSKDKVKLPVLQDAGDEDVYLIAGGCVLAMTALHLPQAFQNRVFASVSTMQPSARGKLYAALRKACADNDKAAVSQILEDMVAQATS